MSPTIGPGPDDRHLHDEVVKARRLEARQRGHLRARFHLEDANRVGFLQQLVHGGIVGGEVGEIERDGMRDRDACADPPVSLPPFPHPSDPASPIPLPLPCCIHQLNGVLQHRHHAKPEEVHFDNAHLGAIVLVPLHDDAAGHRGRFERHDRIELALANHHPAGMLTEMPRQILDAHPQLGERPHARHVERQTDGLQIPAQRLVRIRELEMVHHLGQPIDRIVIE